MPEHSRKSPSYLERAVRLLNEHQGLQFLSALAIILAFKSATLFDPPVWDAAMGLFPAAHTLSANNFNLLELLAMPGFMEGGPNTHSTSPVTLITALVLRASGGGGPQSFVVLHLMHFTTAAYALVVLFALVKPVFGRGPTALYCFAVLLFPVFSTQVGHMYLEVPLFLCAVCALRAWTNQRFWSAVLWAAAAFTVKQIGIILPATLVVATLLEDRSVRLKVKRVALILAPLAILGATGQLLDYLATPGSGQAPPWLSLGDAFLSILHYLDRYVLKVPDLWALFVLFIAAVPMLGPPVLKTLRSEPTAPGDRDSNSQAKLVVGYSGILIILFVLLFLIVVPTAFKYSILLPRYSVVVAPFLLLWLGYVINRFMGARFPSAMPAGFAVLAMLFAVNANGVLYPMDVDTRGPGNDPALTERSNAYRRLLALEVQAIRAVQALPDDVPVYYGQYEHYLLNYPSSGFAEAPLSNGHNFFLESLDDVVRGESMAPCIYALYSYPGLGGSQILELIAYADAKEGLSSEIVQEFRDGRYAMTLVRIQKDGAVCPR